MLLLHVLHASNCIIDVYIYSMCIVATCITRSEEHVFMYVAASQIRVHVAAYV